MWYARIIFAVYVGYFSFHEWGWWAAPLGFMFTLAVTYPLQWGWMKARERLIPEAATRDARRALGMESQQNPINQRSSGEELINYVITERAKGKDDDAIRNDLTTFLDEEDANHILTRASSIAAMHNRPEFLVSEDLSEAFCSQLISDGFGDPLREILISSGTSENEANKFVDSFEDIINTPDPVYPPGLSITNANDRQRAALSALRDTVSDAANEGRSAEYVALRISYFSGVAIKDSMRFVRHVYGLPAHE